MQLHLDLIGGIAGDMFVASIIDCFPDLETKLLNDLEKCFPNTIIFSFSKSKSNGIAGKRFNVKLDKSIKENSLSLKEMEKFIKNTPLNDKTIKTALKIIKYLGKAESKIHQVSYEDVHFHEVGDWDSVGDILAASWLISNLNSKDWSCSTIPIGNGKIFTKHGWIPLPAPASAELLKGYKVFNDGIHGERVTPTGAAILKVIGPSQNKDDANKTIGNIGYGLGTKSLINTPNILRVISFNQSKETFLSEKIKVITFDIDDQTPEELAVSLDKIRSLEKVKDITQGFRIGKKGRSSFHIEILVDSKEIEKIVKEIFLQTSTIGIRIFDCERVLLKRVSNSVIIDNKKLKVKKVRRGENLYSTKIESDYIQGENLIDRRKFQETLNEKHKRKN